MDSWRVRGSRWGLWRGGFCLTLVLALGLGLAVAPAWAEGVQTGVLAGEVVDDGGASLEGVKVAVAGGSVERSTVTDAQGRFRFPALPEGGYSVEAELLGLVAQETAAVYIGTTTELRLALSPAEGGPAEGAAEPEGDDDATVEESIQVVALAPLLDPYDLRVGTTVRASFLDDLPVERIYQSVALLLPGVAGGEDGNPNVSGALRGSNLFLIDGVDTTDPTTGLFGLNLSLDAVSAVDVTTAAAPVQHGRGTGGLVNVVTRSGSNDFAGSLRWLATNPEWNDGYDHPGEEVFHLLPELQAAQSAPGDLDSTLAATLGGPLWADHLWFFTSYETAEGSFFRPTRDGFLWNEGVDLESNTFKVTWRPGSGHTVEMQRTADDAEFAAFTPFERGPTENKAGSQPTPLGGSVVSPLPGDIFALQNQRQEGDFTKLQWSWVPGPKLSLEVVAARQRRQLLREPRSLRELTASAPHVAVTRFALDGPDGEIRFQEVVLFNGIAEEGFEDRPRDQVNVSVNRFFRLGKTDHDVRAGVDFQSTESERRFNVPGLRGADPATGRAAEGQLFLDLDRRPACVLEGDCTPFDPGSGEFQPFSLLSFWQRPARATSGESWAFYLDDEVSRDRWLLSAGLRAERTEGIDDRGRTILEDEVVAPRLGLKIDPVGDGKVLLSASAARYYEPMPHQFLDAFARFQVFSGYTQYTWAGAFGVDCRGQSPANLTAPCWVPTEAVDFQRVQLANPDRNLERPYVDELVVGFERQLTRTTSLQLHYVDRTWNDLWDNVLAFVGGGPNQPGGLRAQVRNLDFAERSYRGLQFLLQRRYADGWQLLGSYTWSEAEGNLFRDDGLDSFADFIGLTDANVLNREGPAPYDRTHRLRLFGTYRLPWQKIAVVLGGAFRFDSGVPYQAQVEGDFGELFLTPRGELESPDVLQLDLSLTARLKPAKNLELEVKAEVFNATDEQERLASESNADLPYFGLAPTTVDLQEPRSYRLSVGLRF